MLKVQLYIIFFNYSKQLLNNGFDLSG